MQKHENKTILSSFVFKFTESFGNQAISFIVSIFLARLLSPNDYGILAILAVFIAISQVFIQSGLNTALIQKKNIDEVYLSSAFYFSLFMATVLYIVLYFTAPAIATFFENDILVPVLRVLAFILFPGAFICVENAIIARKMQFKKLMFSSFIATLISGIVGLYMAYNGYSYWSLVGQQLANQISLSMILLFAIDWKPKFIFSFKKLSDLLSFGWKLLVSGIIDVVYVNLRSILIGKKFDSSTLGFFNRGKQFPELVMNSINGSIQSVILPVLSSKQENKDHMRLLMRRSIMVSTYFVFPMMMGLALVAEPLISVLLTDKWLPCVPFLQICCIDFAFFPIHTNNLQAINAKGRSDIFLKIEIIKKTYGVALLFIAVFFFKSAYAIVICSAISTFISAFVNAAPNKKLLNYGIYEQFKDILPIFFITLFMGLLVYIVSFINVSAILLILIEIIVGFLVYVILSHIFKLSSYYFAKDAIKSLIRR